MILTFIKLTYVCCHGVRLYNESMENEKIFLLGGMDLEMCTIRDMLSERHVTFYDRSLRWDNAVLSQYHDVLEQYAGVDGVTIYGIELTEDTDCPANYVRIDHHNDFSNRPSSLLQVADIMDVPVSRFYQLVAVNDERYIPGMLSMGASDKEISRIRMLDRKSQGVTEEDEQAAVRSINENKILCGNLTVLRSYSRAFSPICDRLYPYGNLLVYTEHEAVYYGSMVPQLKCMFAAEVKAHRMFYGGNDGYFGIAAGAYGESEFNEKINQIVQLHL